MTIPNTKESQRVLAEEIAKQVADNSGWKSITSNYARIYQAAFLGVVKTCERLAASAASDAEFQIDNMETIRPGGGPITNLCREVEFETRYANPPGSNPCNEIIGGSQDDVLVEIDESRP
jgi:hypothetical protein